MGEGSCVYKEKKNLRPAAVVYPALLRVTVARLLEGGVDGDGRDAGTAGGDDGLRRVHAFLLEELP